MMGKSQKRLARFDRHVTSKGEPYGKCIGQKLIEHEKLDAKGKPYKTGTTTTTYYHVTKGRKRVTAGDSVRLRYMLEMLYNRAMQGA